MMLRTLLLSALWLGCSGCLRNPPLVGAPHSQYGRGAAKREGPPVYDCQRNWIAGSTCTPRPTATPRRAPTLAAAGPQDTNLLRDGTLVTRSNVPGGSVALRGRPATEPSHVLLTLRSTQRLSPAPCTVRVFRDGDALAVQESARTSDYQLQLAIEVAKLQRLEQSTRFAVEGCGRTLELDAPARATLSQFEVRFREERSKLAAQP